MCEALLNFVEQTVYDQTRPADTPEDQWQQMQIERLEQVVEEGGCAYQTTLESIAEENKPTITEGIPPAAA